jgi:hypothetical protein
VKAQPARTPWSGLIRQILLDGEWHDRMTVVRTAAALVPPSVAYRKAEKHRLASSTQRGTPPVPERVRGDTHDAVKVGSRHVVTDNLWSMYQNGAVERDLENDRIRATPKAIEAWARFRDNPTRSVELPPLSMPDARLLYAVLLTWCHEHRTDETLWGEIDKLRALVEDRLQR